MSWLSLGRASKDECIVLSVAFASSTLSLTNNWLWCLLRVEVTR